MTEPTASASPMTILFVDDEASILSALRRLFRPHGYRILTAEGGAAGLQILAAEQVDLVVSDMRMPEMDGAKFLEKVHAGWPGVVRILLTGYADITSTIDAINKGGIFRYISKPWDEREIVLTVRDALERQRLQSENARLLALTQKQNEELKSLNTGLEARVAERTVELEQANGRLKQNFLVSIKVFSGLMELREGSVGGHARRVADLARKLSIQLGLDGKAQQDVFIAGLLHDIGKIGFSDAMLTRPVPQMNNDELEHYRQHAQSGARALMPLAEMKPVAELIAAHHERFDGQGFPAGIEGTAIPIGARILAVANDYDSLQYGTLAGKKFSPDEARNMLIQSSGRRYCPKVVDAMVEVLGKPRVESGRQIVVPVDELAIGMVLARDLLARDGTLLLAADYVIDANLLREIQRFSQQQAPNMVLRIRADKKLG